MPPKKWICKDRNNSGDPASTQAALQPLSDWIACGMPDPIPNELVTATMKNCQTNRAAALESWRQYREKKRSLVAIEENEPAEWQKGFAVELSSKSNKNTDKNNLSKANAA
ncbi:MAG: hypothetical protein NTX50_08260 [Candidatus Sumerlaeota bacterium]|nr:hypothetical protein [Candidatus Sumerlaeota bacterium]